MVLPDAWFGEMPEEIEYIVRQTIEFTQIAPVPDYALHREYLARCSKLFDIENSAINLLYTCEEKDDYYYMTVIPKIEQVNNIIKIQKEDNERFSRIFNVN